MKGTLLQLLVYLWKPQKISKEQNNCGKALRRLVTSAGMRYKIIINHLYYIKSFKIFPMQCLKQYTWDTEDYSEGSVCFLLLRSYYHRSPRFQSRVNASTKLQIFKNYCCQ